MQRSRAARRLPALARWSRLAFVSLGVGGVTSGCAAPSPEAWLERAPDVAARGGDATVTYFAPDEVDAVARLVTPITPAYPPAMRARGREGDVVARVLVRADGSVAGAKLLSASDDAFVDAARAHIRGARFAAALRGGEPVPSWVIVRVRFRLA